MIDAPETFTAYFASGGVPNEQKFDLDNVFIQFLNNIELLNERKISYYSESNILEDAKFIEKIFAVMVRFELDSRGLGAFELKGAQRFKTDLMVIQYITFFNQVLKNLKPNDKFGGRPDVSENLVKMKIIQKNITKIISRAKSNQSDLWKEHLLNANSFVLI